MTATVARASIAPTAEQIDRAKQAIDAYISTIQQHPDSRSGAYPYYLFHPAGVPIRGTVLVFHGFSAKPHQMWRLADYLFQNGFNVYQPSLAGHTLINPAKNWPQVDLKPEYAEPLKQKINNDPVLQNFFGNLASGGDMPRPNRRQQIALTARMLWLEPRLLDIIKAIESPNDPDFDRYFTSSHLDYLTNAQARLKEVESIPGPIYTVGLSVGGAVALALAASRPDRVQRVMAYAPLLQVYGDDRRKYVNLAGPLDIKELGWDPNLQFPVGALTAANRFGGSVVMSKASMEALKKIPTFLVLTENEDAADIETSQQFVKQLGGERNNHLSYLYRAQDLVPHPMVDPTEVSQGMSNRFWQSLYQETFRFLTTGTANLKNLNNLAQEADLPAVPPVQ